MSEIAAGEIEPGLVAFLSPGLMEELGAACSTSRAARIRGDHFFVCLSTPDADGDVRWAPCTTKPGVGRVAVAPTMRSGHESWVQGPCFVNVRQVWLVNVHTITAASFVDVSEPGKRNRLNLDVLKGKT